MASPDEADALALTFAEAVAPRWPEPAVHWTRQAARRDVEGEWEDVYRELREE
ncbi:hypothetical protein QH494_26070 [Sphingomonas sp. AR_OL41]|uniref:hypothetical protein n=1 Tax=Sphingomonas sp. AR_OL41 TaxID=3042729 RepID=UPI0024802F83|nr:hypothetical protein [Sphingomonas sp. AR_OL41]MDH7975667.1 hypothetical protein [Sphingomonas sp. AR_OL41]